jgi:hypothetical protein
LIPDGLALSLDVATKTFNVGTKNGDVGALTLDVGTKTFNVAGKTFDVARKTFEVFGLKISGKRLIFSHLRENSPNQAKSADFRFQPVGNACMWHAATRRRFPIGSHVSQFPSADLAGLFSGEAARRRKRPPGRAHSGRSGRHPCLT